MRSPSRALHCLAAAIAWTVFAAIAQSIPSFPVGFNVQGLTYYGQPIFNDVMTGTSDWITWHDGSGWNTEKGEQLELDSNGYPVELPQTIDGQATKVRCMINNCYTGRFRVLWDGDGEITWNVTHELVDGKHYISLNGACDHKWIQITRSTRGNHIRNIRILPESLADSYNPSKGEHLFLPAFTKGLEPFHCIRFMDWLGTNGSNHKRWSDRPTPTNYTQGTRGICIEYAIALCNYLGTDGWFCVPHAADDEYVSNFARMVRDGLNPGLKAYVEYSNEIWNWGFAQAHWVGKNGRDGAHPELDCHDTLYQQFRQVAQDYCSDPESYCHPEKDAHAMQRVFNIWRSAFAETGQTSRLVRVAAIQEGWCGNNQRILKHLAKYGGADAISPTAYFNFTQEDHDQWMQSPTTVTPQMVITSVADAMDSPSFWECAKTTAEDAVEYGLDIVIYEAGQHMQPWQQGEHPYNQAVWDAQIHPDMYDLYIKNFAVRDGIYRSLGTGITLCCAFSYVGARESRWGSWGHLENYGQLDDMSSLKQAAPKYQAMLDFNAARSPVIASRPRSSDQFALKGGGLEMGSARSEHIMYSVSGRRVAAAPGSRYPSLKHQGVYIVTTGTLGTQGSRLLTIVP